MRSTATPASCSHGDAFDSASASAERVTSRGMRVLLFTGKGGVGKTTIAAATGLTLAARGLKTLVMSVDAAHSLADAFDRDVALTDHAQGTAVAVGENLWIQEVDVTEEIGRHWKDISGYITTLLAVTGVEEVLAEELAIFPGME